MTTSAPGGEARLALGAGVGCYLIWGFLPLIFQVLQRLGVSPWEILAERTLWAVPSAAVFVLLARQGPQVLAVFRRPQVLGWLTLSALLIGGNWTAYIWAVNSGRVLEVALGYYVIPLIAMAAGALIFRERIDRVGALAMGCAAVGVAFQALALGHVPLVSLTVALTFGGYGIVRKRVAADAQTGFFIECLLLSIPSLAYAIWLHRTGVGHFGASTPATLWLIACGPVSATPLVLFAWAARRMPLSLIGFLQFISPTLSFLVGVAEGEAFTPMRAASFGFIWGGAAIFAWGAWRRSRAVMRAVASAEPA